MTTYSIEKEEIENILLSSINESQNSNHCDREEVNLDIYSLQITEAFL